jgi:ribA/ribD-fused uncharacterized protein
VNEPITSFKGEFSFLSNFYPAKITFYDGIEYPTAEHAYQAQKFLKEHRLDIAKLDTPGKAKRAGRQAKMTAYQLEAFEMIKIDIMRQILCAKFELPVLKSMLIATGNRKLIEGNTWGDTFWGVCRGEGANWLGRLLEQVRTEKLAERAVRGRK